MGQLAVMHPKLIPFCNAVRLLVTRNGNYHFPYYDLFTEVDRFSCKEIEIPFSSNFLSYFWFEGRCTALG